MITVKIKASGVTLTPAQPVVTSGSAGTVLCEFEFDGEWQGLAKTAVFYTARGNFFVVIEDGKCTFPAAALCSAGDVKIGVFGTDGTRTLTSLLCKVRVSQGTTATAERAENYVPSMYEQLYAKLEKVENLEVCAAYGDEAAAQFLDEDGELTLYLTLPRGEQGEKGDKGDNYIITEADKAEIAESAAATVKAGLRETVYVSLDGYCYSKDGVAYSITNLNLSGEHEKRYNFVLFDTDDAGTETVFQAPLSVWHCKGMDSIYCTAVWYQGDGGLYSANGILDLFGSDDAITFSVQKVAGEGLIDNYGVLSVDKDALLGDVESALDEIIALEEAYIGGDSE